MLTSYLMVFHKFLKVELLVCGMLINNIDFVTLWEDADYEAQVELTNEEQTYILMEEDIL